MSPEAARRAAGGGGASTAAVEPAGTDWVRVGGYVGLAVMASAALLATVYWSMPELAEAQREAVHGALPPRSYSDVLALRAALQDYAMEYRRSTLTAIISLYMVMQTFGVPGTIYLSLLASGLYGFDFAFPILLVASTIGASLCYGLSLLVGRAIAYHVWPDKMAKFAREIGRRRKKMASYMIFLRLTPLFPNVFINVAAPIVDVPFSAFLFGTLVGTVPNNILSAKAGEKLAELGSFTYAELFDKNTVVLLAVLGGMVLVPTMFGGSAGPDEDAASPKKDKGS
mmetsp:Transcript_11032/g.38309  ORF Transcript_11032/g.38309 Transcript_11032/m.38309 type:complete len:284 (+) Transcript_11032:187-1038(+)